MVALTKTMKNINVIIMAAAAILSSVLLMGCCGTEVSATIPMQSTSENQQETAAAEATNSDYAIIGNTDELVQNVQVDGNIVSLTLGIPETGYIWECVDECTNGNHVSEISNKVDNDVCHLSLEVSEGKGECIRLSCNEKSKTMWDDDGYLYRVRYIFNAEGQSLSKVEFYKVEDIASALSSYSKETISTIESKIHEELYGIDLTDLAVFKKDDCIKIDLWKESGQKYTITVDDGEITNIVEEGEAE